ncbi:hypothetical protein [Kozakia baliensis]|uniref:hypothetical protein n=1 Tax=Kozakia baliensis TaxID=153496 RepID=UPI00222EF203|nr:hypothetical protein [Kozakia baliensis]
MAVVTDDGLSAAREDVLAELLRLKGERRAFRIGISLFNLVDRPGWFAVDPEFLQGFSCERGPRMWSITASTIPIPG